MINLAFLPRQIIGSIPVIINSRAHHFHLGPSPAPVTRTRRSYLVARSTSLEPFFPLVSFGVFNRALSRNFLRQAAIRAGPMLRASIIGEIKNLEERRGRGGVAVGLGQSAILPRNLIGLIKLARDTRRSSAVPSRPVRFVNRPARDREGS